MVNSYENSQDSMKKVRDLTMIMYVGEKPSGVVCVLGWMRQGVLKERERKKERGRENACEGLMVWVSGLRSINETTRRGGLYISINRAFDN